MKLTVPLLAALTAAIVPLASFAYTGQQLEKTVKIDAGQARAAALKKEPGTILDVELEKEKGGTGIRYTFTIRARGVKREVGIDANTGLVLEDAVESKDAD